ncbi:hypothetical protein QBC35DRAFT_36447 [Podospora australis]|uniref:Uncharacterized protein n=1 Tax=Podospora australis TaxID=1536484 RepID=A0AAN7AM36_9PEZI|nr:hypothetical protein QBC35DRAFT_36447 [Podospora australis]
MVRVCAVWCVFAVCCSEKIKSEVTDQVRFSSVMFGWIAKLAGSLGIGLRVLADALLAVRPPDPTGNRVKAERQKSCSGATLALRSVAQLSRLPCDGRDEKMRARELVKVSLTPNKK